MKVVLIAGERWAHWRLLQLDDLISVLHQAGHEVMILGLHDIQSNGIHPQCQRFAFRKRAIRWSYQFQYLEMRDRLDKWQADLIHVIDPEYIDPGVRLATDLNLPVIVSFWGEQRIQQLRSLTLPSASNQVMLTAASQQGIDLIRDKFTEDFQVKLFHGIPQSSFDTEMQESPEQEAAEASLCLLHQGPVTSHLKQCLKILASELKHQDHWHVFLYCDHRHTNAIWKYARKCDLVRHINVVESISTQLQLMMKSPLVIHTSMDHECDALLQQAMSQGSVLITHERAHLRAGFLKHGRQIWRVENEVPHAWTDALSTLIHDSDRRRDISESVASATRHWRQEPSIGHRAKHLYEKMVQPANIAFNPLVA